jgi:hypothetical protein
MATLGRLTLQEIAPHGVKEDPSVYCALADEQCIQSRDREMGTWLSLGCSLQGVLRPSTLLD